MIKVKRALISVSDKNGLAEFAKGLHALGIELLSTGGTAQLLQSAGLPVKEVAQYTGFPEILDGRVKTLHPAIHGGLLALRDNKEHMDQISERNIGLIDMVVVNLYPFERTVAKKNVSLKEALENIDIGGPSMLRSAAKNFKSVAVICNPKRYKEVLCELQNNSGLLSDAVLRGLAVEAFGHTGQYDSMIYAFLNSRLKGANLSEFPKDLTLALTKVQDLRYGENPHQKAALYSTGKEPAGLARLKQLHGKELSFNNLLDLNAALSVVREFVEPAAVIVKHNNPTGVAVDKTLSSAYSAAYRCDPVSAFGGIIGLNRKVDEAAARKISQSGFMECIIAPGYDHGALSLLTKKKNLRLIELKWPSSSDENWDFKQIEGGMLLQDKDTLQLDPSTVTCPTKLKPTKAQMAAMLFGWKVVKHIRSNAIVLVKGQKTVGIGCGQTSRVESTLLAVKKAGANARGAWMISDAFLPKTDNVVFAAKAGIKGIMQTGGSIADEDVIKAANKAKIVMVMTGVRHFKH